MITRPAPCLLVVPLLALSGTIGRAQTAAVPSAADKPEETIYLPLFTVSTNAVAGYKATNSSSGTRTATAIIDIPQSISVLTSEFLADQQAFKLEDAFNYVAGVQRTAFNGNFNVRGFTFGPPLRDGAIGATVTDTSMIERVEVVRGPAAALYGRSTPGGVINIITKRPSAKAAYSGLLSYASYDVKRVEGSATGPITSDKSLLYRFDGAYQNGNTFRWFERQEVTALNPTLAWRPTANTIVSLTFTSVNSSYDSPPSVLPLDATQSFFIPGVKWQYNKKEPDIAFRDTLDESWTLELQHQITPGLSFRSISRRADFTANEVNITGFSVAPGTTRMNRVYQLIPTDAERWVTQNDVVGRFEAGGFKHTVLLGADFTKIENENYRYTRAIAPLDVFNPAYGNQPTGPSTLAIGTLAIDNYGGGYLNARSMGLNGRVSFHGGVRYDVYRTRSFNRLLANARTDSNGKKSSPQVGATFALLPGLSTYVLYARSYVPNPGVNPDGSQFSPTQGEEKEVGFKLDLLGGRLSGTLGIYDITQDNSLVNDRNRPGFNIPTGEYRSRGVDFDLLWQASDNLVFLGAYAYTDAFVVNDSNPARIGVQGTDVAHHRASGWTKYTVRRGALAGADFGLGAIYVGPRLSGLGSGNATMPSYTRFDASIGYSWRRTEAKYRFSVSARNLTDKRYFEYGAEPGAPLSFIASLRADF
jgi:iron complex outermembrane receptor protein